MFDLTVNLRAKDSTTAADLCNSWDRTNFNHTYDFERKLDFTVQPGDSYRYTHTPSKNYMSVYTCGYIVDNTASSLLYESNGAAIDKALEPYRDRTVVTPEGQTEPAAVVVNSMYWAVAVYDKSAEDTDGLAEAFLMCLDLARDLEAYPVLDDDDYYRREWENEQEYLEDLARQLNGDVEDFYEDWDTAIPLVYTAGMLWNAIRDNDINFGYSWYGECYMRDSDLERAAFLAALDTYESVPFSD